MREGDFKNNCEASVLSQVVHQERRNKKERILFAWENDLNLTTALVCFSP
jgi:hypothetical protein